jgi:hypothetical protein
MNATEGMVDVAEARDAVLAQFGYYPSSRTASRPNDVVYTSPDGFMPNLEFHELAVPDSVAVTRMLARLCYHAGKHDARSEVGSYLHGLVCAGRVE